MKDINSESIRLNDKLKLSNSDVGVVVCNIDGNEYSDKYPRSDWQYLARGILVETEQAGLIHLTSDMKELENIEVICSR